MQQQEEEEESPDISTAPLRAARPSGRTSRATHPSRRATPTSGIALPGFGLSPNGQLVDGGAGRRSSRRCRRRGRGEPELLRDV